AGRLVTKEDLLNEVWQGTFVEETNLTYTVSLLRKALGDDAEPHAFIETVAERGYRFTGAVTRGGHEEPAGALRARRPALWLVASIVAMLLLAIASWGVLHHRVADTSAGVVPDETRLEVVTPPTSSPNAFDISPDGRNIVYVAMSGQSRVLWVRAFSLD